MTNSIDYNIRKFKQQSELLITLIQSQAAGKTWDPNTIIVRNGKLTSVGGEWKPKNPPASRTLTPAQMAAFLRGEIKSFADVDRGVGGADVANFDKTDLKTIDNPEAKNLIVSIKDSLMDAIGAITTSGSNIAALWNNPSVNEMKGQIANTMGSEVGPEAETAFGRTIRAFSTAINTSLQATGGFVTSMKDGIDLIINSIVNKMVEEGDTEAVILKKSIGITFSLLLVRSVFEVLVGDIAIDIAIAGIAGGAIGAVLGALVASKMIKLISRTFKHDPSVSDDIQENMIGVIKESENTETPVDEVTDTKNSNEDTRDIETPVDKVTGNENINEGTIDTETPVNEVTDTKNSNEDTRDIETPVDKVTDTQTESELSYYDPVLNILTHPEVKELQEKASNKLNNPESKKTFKDTINNFLRVISNFDEGVREVDQSLLKNAGDFLDEANKVDIAEDFSNAKEVIGRNAAYRFISNVLESPVKGIGKITNSMLKSIAEDNIRHLFLPKQSTADRFAEDFFAKNQKKYKEQIKERINNGLLNTIESADILFKDTNKQNWWSMDKSSFIKDLTRNVKDYYANEDSYIKELSTPTQGKQQIEESLQNEINSLINIYKLQSIDPFRGSESDIPLLFKNIQGLGTKGQIDEDIEKYINGDKSAIRSFQNKVSKELEQKYEKILKEETDIAVGQLITKYGLKVTPKKRK